MKKIFVLILLTCSVINLPPAFGLSGIDAGSINSKNVLDLKLHESVSRARAKSAVLKKEEIEQPSEQLQELNRTALTDIKNIAFINNNSVSSKELYRVIQGYINQPMNVQNVSAIRKEIMKYYQKKGYYSAIALINSENTQTGELILDIKEGGKNSIIIQP